MRQIEDNPGITLKAFDIDAASRSKAI